MAHSCKECPIVNSPANINHANCFSPLSAFHSWGMSGEVEFAKEMLEIIKQAPEISDNLSERLIEMNYELL